MKLTTITRRVHLLAVVALMPSALASSMNAEKPELAREGMELIRQLEIVGRDVRYNAGRLNALAGSFHVSRWSHVHHLEQIRALVNEGLRPALTRLEEIQPQLPDWKRQSIDRMIAAAKALAADTSSAILAKNQADTVALPMNAEYKAFLAKVHQHAEDLVKTSDAAGTYAAARLKANQAGLGVPRS